MSQNETPVAYINKHDELIIDGVLTAYNVTRLMPLPMARSLKKLVEKIK